MEWMIYTESVAQFMIDLSNIYPMMWEPVLAKAPNIDGVEVFVCWPYTFNDPEIMDFMIPDLSGYWIVDDINVHLIIQEGCQSL